MRFRSAGAWRPRLESPTSRGAISGATRARAPEPAPRAGSRRECTPVAAPGAAVGLGLLGLPALIRAGDLMVVAEGRLDRSSWMGKAPVAVARAARRAGARVLAVCGSVEPAAEVRFAREFGPVFPLVPEASMAAEGSRHAGRFLGEALTRALRAVRMGEGRRRDRN